MKFFEPKYKKIFGEGKILGSDVIVRTKAASIYEKISNVLRPAEVGAEQYAELQFVRGVPYTVIEKVNDAFGDVWKSNEEGYVICAEGDGVTVWSPSERGLLYGAIELTKMIAQSAKLPELLLYDYPDCDVRGVKVFLPAQGELTAFYQLVDMLCEYKHNTIMIEIGGAMEYHSHPEINAGWVEYCKDIQEYSGKSIEIQEAFDWAKNSMHVDNGGGGYLSQETVRTLVRYCKEHFLNVVPEVPSLSHCDYLLLGNPDIRERSEDPYPDTVCPSNPKTYRILFDILEEIIDVFQPEKINMGHDEFYSIGLCPRCRNKPAWKIFSDDIWKIYEFLRARGIKMEIWGEKLLNPIIPKGFWGGGGAVTPRGSFGKVFEKLKPTWQALDHVPNDLQILHWYWQVDEGCEEDFSKRGMDITYGNFAGSQFNRWTERVKKGKIHGAIVSNWGALNLPYLQRNGILFEMVYASLLCWNADFDDSQQEAAREAVFRELYRYRLTECQGAAKGDWFRVVHTTGKKFPYVGFVDGVFIEADKYHVGDYVVEYENGETERVPVQYGETVSNDAITFEAEPDSYVETAYFSYPKTVNGRRCYEAVYRNPRPGKTIRKITVESVEEEYPIENLEIEIL